MSTQKPTPAAMRAASEIQSEWDLDNGAREPQEPLIAEIIDRETGLPEAIEALQAIQYMAQQSVSPEIKDLIDQIKRVSGTALTLLEKGKQ